MKGDFTRNTFDPTNHFSRVLVQQGRVQLDADWNEQVAILLHYLQALAADLIGPHGYPITGGFAIEGSSESRDFTIGNGRYYVDGILCENDGYLDPESNAAKLWTYFSQPHYPLDKENDQLAAGTSLVYLDVWERDLTYVEQEDAEGHVISIRESALGGPDTAMRVQVVWQVKAKSGIGACPDDATWKNLVEEWQATNRGLLKACAVRPESTGADNPCSTPPQSRYRGLENQLYRVEIHRGTVYLGGGTDTKPTFKWSRENGSVIFPIESKEDNGYVVTGLRSDRRCGLQPGDWVEYVDDKITLRNEAFELLKVDSIDPDTHKVKFVTNDLPGPDKAKHPFLRRWDQHNTETCTPDELGIEIVEAASNDEHWLELEDGVEIQFQPGAKYRTGDYWLIPARTATGDVDWPGAVGEPQPRPPHGVQHHYAPLAIVSVDDTVSIISDCRRPFEELTKLTAAGGGSAKVTGEKLIAGAEAKAAARKVERPKRNKKVVAPS